MYISPKHTKSNFDLCVFFAFSSFTKQCSFTHINVDIYGSFISPVVWYNVIVVVSLSFWDHAVLSSFWLSVSGGHTDERMNWSSDVSILEHNEDQLPRKDYWSLSK